LHVEFGAKLFVLLGIRECFTIKILSIIPIYYVMFFQGFSNVAEQYSGEA